MRGARLWNVFDCGLYRFGLFGLGLLHEKHVSFGVSGTDKIGKNLQ